MARTIAFKLMTPSRVIYDGRAELVIVVTTEGEEGILPSHAPLLAALKPGVLRANVADDAGVSRLMVATGEGFLQALPDRVTVLVDEALHFDDVDVAAARRELADATGRQRAPGTDPAAFAREQVIIDFAAAKLRLTGH
ncbi:MAG: ATP synthase F1 subunit epsilon [Vulcanimicrobiaceae bacterium]